MLERAPQAAGLDAHDRIALRIKSAVAAERVGGNRIGLDAAAIAGKLLLHHEAEEVGELRRLAEMGARNHTIQRGANFQVARLLALSLIHISEPTRQAEIS